MQPIYFGQPDPNLFGIYHPPRGIPAPPVRAVVICPPFGQEYIRSHWCLRLLAGQLARKGMHVLRFDYHGLGDSLGEPVDVTSLQQWRDNVVAAKNWLKEKTDATSCMLVGLGTGASLAVETANVCDDISSLVLWEPCGDGAKWLEKRRQMHAEMLDLWVCHMETRNDSDGEEILGALYSRSLIDDFSRFAIDWSKIQLPHLLVDVAEHQNKYTSENPMRKAMFTDDENSWDDLRQLETAWLRPQTVRTIVNDVYDMFERLKRFGAFNDSMTGVR